MFKIEQSKSGHSYAIYNGLHLHSRYDPEREARKFVASHIGNRTPDTAIVVGSGLGYIAAELRRRGVFTIQIFLSPFTYSAAVEHGDVAWAPESKQESSIDAVTDQARHNVDEAALRAFLRSQLSDTDSVGLEVLSWTPCMEAFPDEAEEALEVVVDVVRESNANLTTIAAFGTRWFRNLCTNFRDTRAVQGAAFSSKHVVIAAAGPSLEAAIPALQEFYHLQGEIWAVGTALRPLISAGIRPSLVVTTDAGYYALEHLNAVRTSPDYCIAAPLTAAQGITRRGSGLLLINQGSIIEQELFSNCRLPVTCVPANGTVAGSALELALRVCSGRVVLVGLDLGYRDIQPHARPHSFEHYLERQESRLRPLYGMFAARALEHSARISGGRRTTRQLDTYAQWFQRRLSQLQHRVATLGPSLLEIGAPHISHSELMQLAKENRLAVTAPHGVRTRIQKYSEGGSGDASTYRSAEGSADAWTVELTDLERSKTLSSMLGALETRVERVAAVTTRQQFLSLLHPRRSQSTHERPGLHAADIEVLSYLNCRGVLNCIRQASPTAFRAELADTVETVRTLLHEQKREQA
ncbi:MAG: DUF115 domain-containing protein [Spirochaetaceae bacterium]|nr:MAG: DUF115 domain-containing protein [Spirochaetaceae bacterium]